LLADSRARGEVADGKYPFGVVYAVIGVGTRRDDRDDPVRRSAAWTAPWCRRAPATRTAHGTSITVPRSGTVRKPNHFALSDAPPTSWARVPPTILAGRPPGSRATAGLRSRAPCSPPAGPGRGGALAPTGLYPGMRARCRFSATCNDWQRGGKSPGFGGLAKRAPGVAIAQMNASTRMGSPSGALSMGRYSTSGGWWIGGVDNA
jgi:hypothetical protein